MKKYKSLLLLALVTICAIVGFYITRPNTRSIISPTINATDYNPNYADAIQLKKPKLCQSINYALQSGQTDSIDKVTGKESVMICESQAKAGFLGCECDADAVLNKMRER